MKGAKELADRMRRAEQHGFAPSAGDMALLVRELDRLAAIDGAGLGEAGEIKARFDAGAAGENILQAVHDIKTLLAIVQRQAGRIDSLEESLRHNPAVYELYRDASTLQQESAASRSKVTQLTERLRVMQHGEAEALKMMAAEKQRADGLAAELATAKERAAKDDAGVTIHACPPKGSGIMPCCGRTPFEVMGDRMSTKPEVVNCDRVRLLTEKTESGLTILRLHAEATEQREMAAASELSAREHKGLADLAMQVVATRTQELMVAEERARALANGIAAYRAGGYTAAQVWENEEGKAVPR